MIAEFFRKFFKLLFSVAAKSSRLFSFVYLSGKSLRSNTKNVKKENDILTCIWDFNASPYALGDILTWNMRICVQAVSTGKNKVDVFIIADPETPGNRCQRYITRSNYHRYLLEMMPVFYFNPMLRNVHVFQDRAGFESFLKEGHVKGIETSPDISEYVAGHIKEKALYNSHDIINAYYKKCGFVPGLTVPLDIDVAVSDLLKRFDPGTFFVCVHMRQRRNETETKAKGRMDRDARIDHWMEFFQAMEKQYPKVRFMVIGRPVELPKELQGLPNVTAVKTLGYGLSEELALIHECNLFMGTNSGPAVMAVFGPKPYVIFEVPGNASMSAKLWGVEVGEKHLPFARKNQIVKWRDTSVDELITTFEEMFEILSAEKKQGIGFQK